MLILNKDLTLSQLHEIAVFKQKAWPEYSVKDHMIWIIENLTSDTAHILKRDIELIAYANVFPVNVKIDGINKTIKGIGNLCSIGKGQGIMLNREIVSSGGYYIGFCKKHLIHVYQYLGWHFPESSKVNIPNIDHDVYHVHTFNLEYQTLEYNLERF